MWVNYGELKTKEDYICLLKEIEAYRELDGEDFDFGTGIINNDMSYGSEDAYYEMAIWELESIIDYWDCDNPNSKHNKKRDTKYARNRTFKNKLWSMVDQQWTHVWMNGKWFEEGTYPKRYYRGKRSTHLKRQSSRKIRRFKGEFQTKGNKHKRVFDFWWELD